MTRTGQQKSRRAHLADASIGVYPSSGRIDRIPVVIHSAGHHMLPEMRARADARDWQVVAEVTTWGKVRELIESAQAQGVVTDATDVGVHAEWLARAAAFLLRVDAIPDAPS
ncbi:hypothetical protein [Streptomyces sp. NPDC048057]|uniref:hypothetical protein n=1 Tax=Streptomyces sp. NPDC048057 TaxID=3155628 RepID=UPI0033F9621F